jgi:hypothetical protein
MSLRVVGRAPAVDLPTKAHDSKLPSTTSETKFDLRTLRHSNLENNTTFIELKAKLEEYLEDLKLPVQRVMSHKSKHWREVLFSSLLELLCEVTFTREETQQLGLLAKVKKWYENKTALPVSPPVIKRKDPGRPDSRRLTKSTTPLKERMAQIQLKKLDAFPSLELRSPSPTKTPKLPLMVDRQTLNKAGWIDDYPADKLSMRYIEFRERELGEMRATSTRNSKD